VQPLKGGTYLEVFQFIWGHALEEDIRILAPLLCPFFSFFLSFPEAMR
jgi:hypothetical protein